MFCFWYEWFHISEFVFETILDKTNEHNLKEKKNPGYDFNNVNAKKKKILKQLHNFNIIILFDIYPKYESIFMNV